MYSRVALGSVAGRPRYQAQILGFWKAVAASPRATDYSNILRSTLAALDHTCFDSWNFRLMAIPLCECCAVVWHYAICLQSSHASILPFNSQPGFWVFFLGFYAAFFLHTSAFGRSRDNPVFSSVRNRTCIISVESAYIIEVGNLFCSESF